MPEYQTQPWEDEGKGGYTWTIDQAVLTLEEGSWAAHVGMNVRENQYWWGAWWSPTADYPAYLWVTGRIQLNRWGQNFSGKHRLDKADDTFRLAPNFVLPDTGVYTLSYRIHQLGAYYEEEENAIDQSNSAELVVT